MCFSLMLVSIDGQGSLMQPYDEIDELNQLTADISTSQGKTVYHPVSYISGLFRGSQLNWAALMKEAYEIYMSLPPCWTGSNLKIIKANSYVRHNFIQTLVI